MTPLELIPADLLDRFNALTCVDQETFDLEMADADLLTQIDTGGSLITYGLRKLDGSAIIFIEAPEGQRFVFLA